MNNTAYQCVQLSEFNECLAWQVVPDHSGYKLTNEQMSTFIFSIAALFATVAVIKIVRRTFF